MNEQPLDRKDLKTQALLEKISTLTTQYENQVADLRVDLTIVSQQLETAHARISQLESQDETTSPEEDTPANDTD